MYCVFPRILPPGSHAFVIAQFYMPCNVSFPELHRFDMLPKHLIKTDPTLAKKMNSDHDITAEKILLRILMISLFTLLFQCT